LMAWSQNNFRLLSVPSKIHDLPNESAFSNGTCPINVKKMNYIRHVMKYSDHNHQGFWTSILAWETTMKRTRMNKKILG
jgi:hypothetical protein